LRLATLQLRLRKAIGGQATNSQSASVLLAWHDGVSRDKLISAVGGPNAAQKLQNHVGAWLKRFGLDSLGNYEDNLTQIREFARAKGYFEPLNADLGAPGVLPGKDDSGALPAAPRLGRALDVDSLNRAAAIVGPLEADLAKLLPQGLSYRQIASEIANTTGATVAEKTLAVVVNQMLRKFGIEAPASAADLIVALHALGLAPDADHQTLKRSELMVRLREDLGVRLDSSPNRPESLDALQAWADRVPRDVLMSRMGLSKQKLQNYVGDWLKRFGLESRGNYVDNVSQIVEAARDRGYFDAPNADA
jgi:hypothetical protein